ncbi:hypothetical protein ACQP1P_42855 [Dactylosporangium sp. CA-052675]|uniref:hypothetical protein n=1 Tax=Dactylosporangium sp. CA-052675 TaxID=3239927 RepID=UPI003D8B3002
MPSFRQFRSFDDSIGDMKRGTVQRRLTLALSKLIVDDWRLLSLRAPHPLGVGSERSIAAALGWHLKGVMERSWDVDCEYSRAGAGAHVDAKRWSEPRAGATGSRRPTVTPDLVVHRRGLPGPEHNLLVLELKKNDESDRTNEDHSVGRGTIESILDIQHQFEYRHAIYLDLALAPGGLKPQWKWVELGWTGDVSSLNFEPVYGDGDCGELIARGRAEEVRRYGAANSSDLASEHASSSRSVVGPTRRLLGSHELEL